MIDFKCPHCGSGLHVKDSAAGMTGKCKVCKKPITAPDADGASIEPQEEDDWLDEETSDDYVPPKSRNVGSGKSKAKTKKKEQSGGTGLIIIGVAIGSLCILGLGILFGAGFLSSKPTPNGVKDSVAKDPVAEFKQVVSRFVPALNEKYNDFAKRNPVLVGAGPTTMELYGDKSKFDVKKSDSMVSPYTGVIVCDGFFKYAEGGVYKSGIGTFEFTFAYQDGKWVAQSGGITTGTVFMYEGTGTNAGKNRVEFPQSLLQAALDRP